MSTEKEERCPHCGATVYKGLGHCWFCRRELPPIKQTMVPIDSKSSTSVATLGEFKTTKGVPVPPQLESESRRVMNAMTAFIQKLAKYSHDVRFDGLLLDEVNNTTVYKGYGTYDEQWGKQRITQRFLVQADASTRRLIGWHIEPCPQSVRMPSRIGKTNVLTFALGFVAATILFCVLTLAGSM
ncbi:MAG: hypothetical protein ACOC6F_02140 [bacterium]